MLTFMEEVESVGSLKEDCPLAKLELIAVYDYRLVEGLSKMEKGKSFGYDVWKRNMVGALKTFRAA